MESGEWPFDNQETLDNGEGPTQLTVWSAEMGKELLADTHNEGVRRAAAVAELELLRKKFPIAAQALRVIAFDRKRIDYKLIDNELARLRVRKRPSG